MFFCEKCNRHVLHVVPKIKVQVIDVIDCATFVIFDRDANTLLNINCNDMVDVVNKNNAGYVIPKEISELVGKTFLFKFQTKTGYTARFDPSFRVKRLCFDEVIIQKFKSNVATMGGVTGTTENEGTVVQDLMIQFSDMAADSQPVTDDVIDLALTDDSLNLTLVKTGKSAVGGYLGRTTDDTVKDGEFAGSGCTGMLSQGTNEKLVHNVCEAGGSSTTADEDLKLELPQKSAGLTPIKRGSTAQNAGCDGNGDALAAPIPKAIKRTIKVEKK